MSVNDSKNVLEGLQDYHRTSSELSISLPAGVSSVTTLRSFGTYRLAPRNLSHPENVQRTFRHAGHPVGGMDDRTTVRGDTDMSNAETRIVDIIIIRPETKTTSPARIPLAERIHQAPLLDRPARQPDARRHKPFYEA